MSNTREAIFSKDDPEFGSLDNNGEPGEKDTIGALIWKYITILIFQDFQTAIL